MAALRCCEAWLELSPVGGSGCMLSPGELQSQQPRLFAALLQLATAGSGDAVVEAAVQVLLLLFGPENFSADEGADLAATSARLQALLATRGRLAPAPSDVLPAGVAQLASAAAERAPDYCCGHSAEVGGRPPVPSVLPSIANLRCGSPACLRAWALHGPLPPPSLPLPAQAVALSELVLECLCRPGPDMASHTVDYLLMVNTGAGGGGRGSLL